MPLRSKKTIPTLLFIFCSLLIWAYTCLKSPTNSIPYNADGQLLDIFLPASIEKEIAIMFIHGGGFKYGAKEDMAEFAKQYANTGFVTTSINYRLTPKHIYPDAINDTKDALNWMKKNAKKYSYNANKIVLVGYSAGGTLALNIGLDTSQQIAAAISIAGMTDIGSLMRSAPSKDLKQELTIYMGEQNPTEASPLYQVHKTPPPILLIHGDKDDVVPISQSIHLSEKLKKTKTPASIRIFKNSGHEIMYANNLSTQLHQEIMRFILTVETKN